MRGGVQAEVGYRRADVAAMQMKECSDGDHCQLSRPGQPCVPLLTAAQFVSNGGVVALSFHGAGDVSGMGLIDDRSRGRWSSMSSGARHAEAS
jgi:hypothetical protein